MNSINPKKTFREGLHAKGWENVAQSQMFQSAVSAALLEMERSQSFTTVHSDAAAQHFRMQGAHIFSSFLMSLTDPPENTPDRADIGNLDHTV